MRSARSEPPSSSTTGGTGESQGSSSSISPSNVPKRTYGSRKSARKTGICCNERCDRKSPHINKASENILFYFGVTPTPGHRYKICATCLKEVTEYMNKAIDAVKKQEPIFDIPRRCGVPTVALDDDEDSDSDEDKDKDVSTVVVSKDIVGEIEALMAAHGLDIQTQKCNEALEADFDGLEVDFNGIDKTFQDMEVELEDLRKDYEKLTGPHREIVNLASLDINKFGEVRTIVEPKPKVAERVFPKAGFAKKSTDATANLPTTSASALRTHLSKQSEVKPTIGTKADQNCQLPPLKPQTPMKTTLLKPTPSVIPKFTPKVEDKVFVMKSNLLNFWAHGVILEVHSVPRMEFKVRVEVTKNGRIVPNSNGQLKTVGLKQLAYNIPCPFVLPVSSRIIARFEDFLNTEPYGNGNYYAGIVAEIPNPQNRQRYLVFFDDGYAQYVNPVEVFLVCDASKEVWFDIHPDSQPFIKKYLTDFPERPMLRLQQGGAVTTEYCGKWGTARVVELDASLAKLKFEFDGHSEWIYRGSTRLSPLFDKLKGPQKTKARNTAQPGSINKSTIEYTYTGGDTVLERTNRVAKKSTGGVKPLARAVSNTSNPGFSKQPERCLIGEVSSLEQEGKMKRLTIPKDIPQPKEYVRHECNESCVYPFDENEKEYQSKNPLAIPLWLGFAREVSKTPRRRILYRAPCGRRIRNCTELQKFLVETNYNMGIEYFSFDFAIDCLSKFQHFQTGFLMPDITYGKELVVVKCVNRFAIDYPEFVEYTKERIARDDVALNLDEEFLTCCDCVDDCLDKEKCSCWQLTYEGRKFFPSDSARGYEYKRLSTRMITGIFECNQRCKCKSTCSNRVVQNPMRWQLQVYKTEKKGWAIRTLYDIPKGSFICLYAGQILNEQGANEDGTTYGDEYLAELDHIEQLEKHKDGFEEEAIEPSNFFIKPECMDESDSDSSEEDWHAGDTDYRAKVINSERNVSTRRSDSNEMKLEETLTTKIEEVLGISQNVTNEEVSQQSKGGDGNCDDSFVEEDDRKAQRQPSSFEANLTEDQGMETDGEKKQSVRELFGKDDKCYIMDAKSVGNIGRYLNHSCNPNTFVQNVFVDTHDLRFPWLAFFSMNHIRAGSELTWDYGYVPGSVVGRRLYCKCGTPECRGRLL